MPSSISIRSTLRPASAFERSPGVGPREARDAWVRKSKVLAGELEEYESAQSEFDNRTIDDAIEKFLIETKATKAEATLNAYRTDLHWFRQHCFKRYVSRLTRDDVMGLFAKGREEGSNQKTINRRVIVMLNAMRGAGARIELRKGDWPKTIDKKIEIYQPEEFEKFFAACNADERLQFQLFLFTGFRFQEIMTLTWRDINYKDGTVSVSSKPELNFMPKSYEAKCSCAAQIDRFPCRPPEKKQVDAGLPFTVSPDAARLWWEQAR